MPKLPKIAEIERQNLTWKGPILLSSKLYAGTMRMLKSTACGECVSAPTEM